MSLIFEVFICLLIFFPFICRCGTCNGVALWVEWVFENESSIVVSTGPIIQPEIGDTIKWDVHTRQGVTLFQERNVRELGYIFNFRCKDGTIKFVCRLFVYYFPTSLRKRNSVGISLAMKNCTLNSALDES